jgi:hypothetical protein
MFPLLRTFATGSIINIHHYRHFVNIFGKKCFFFDRDQIRALPAVCYHKALGITEVLSHKTPLPTIYNIAVILSIFSEKCRKRQNRLTFFTAFGIPEKDQ